MQYAYRLLSYRGRSEKELRRKFSEKGIDDETAVAIIDRLKANGFIDDIKLASSLTRYAGEHKHMSVSGTRKLLNDRGISRELAEAAVKEIDDTENAKKLVAKKLRHMAGYSPETITKKLYGILSRKGYSYETIKKTLKEFSSKEGLQ